MRLVCLFALLTTCTEPQALDFSYTGSDEGFVQSLAAVEEWNRVCLQSVTLIRGGQNIPLVEVAELKVTVGGVTKSAQGKTELYGYKVHSVTFVRGARGRITVLHELGHALFRSSDHLPRGIMRVAYERVTEDEKVTPYECDFISPPR